MAVADTTANTAKRPRAVSAAAVARATGVSPATVSYVMNGKGGVSTETRRHIVAVANELGFRPRHGGLERSPQLTRVIGLILPNVTNQMYMAWAQSIMDATASEGYEVFVSTTQDDPDTLAQTTSTLAARNVDGVIIAGALRDDTTALRTLRQHRIPYVYLSRHTAFAAGDFVGINDDAAATEVMEHVLRHGYREIATVVGPRISTASLAREQAFVRTASEHGISITGGRKISTRLNSAGGRVAAEKLLAAPTPPRAIVCGTDEIAIGVMECALDRGLRIPQDIAVVGIDGPPHSRSGLINLTTVIQPAPEMGQQAFTLLLGQLTHSDSAYRSVICKHRLHIGRTCGCTQPRS